MVAGLAGIIVVVLIGVYWQDIAAWVKFIYLFESVGRNEQGYPEYRHRQTGIVMVRVPGGSFLMGNAGGPERQPNDVPPHTVNVSSFLIAKTELTQGHWSSVMRANPSKHQELDLPVQWLTWEECKDFCKKTGLNLPTEAQWEYACRAGTTGHYGATGNLDDTGWYRGNSGGGRPRPVGQKKPNRFGLHDMHGNVWEWCEDVYNHDFYGSPEAAGPDPVSTSGSPFRVIRGGGFADARQYCRASTCFGYQSDSENSSFGFRPAYYPLP